MRRGMQMGYLTIIIALGIVAVFGYWSGGRRTKSQMSKKTKVSEINPINKPRGQAKLRRIK
ncbi:hypothetical protein E4K67_11405 [Desulfosporosinus fructosivorans]|uniref:Uncharacterized protein n=2 Tax=Desulfosporosinus fructosivorans TaxID=2018669 RepID=A0A4Z0R7Z1_9FIRM|nr:hypothetical protein E4K67_11405 [Desulfosporosinus fructosivorans]